MVEHFEHTRCLHLRAQNQTCNGGTALITMNTFMKVLPRNSSWNSNNRRRGRTSHNTRYPFINRCAGRMLLCQTAARFNFTRLKTPTSRKFRFSTVLRPASSRINDATLLGFRRPERFHGVVQEAWWLGNDGSDMQSVGYGGMTRMNRNSRDGSGCSGMASYICSLAV